MNPTQPVFNAWSWVSLSVLPRPWLWGSSAALLLAGAWLVYSYRHHRSRFALSALRVAALSAVALLLWQPAIRQQEIHPIPTRIAIVWDRSQSMTLPAQKTKPGKQKPSRHALAIKWLAPLLTSPTTEGVDPWKELKKKHSLEVYDLHGQQHLPSAANPSQTPPQGASSDLVAALIQAANKPKAPPLAGMVLISDGAHANPKEVSIQEVSSAGFSPQEIESLRALQVPINTVQVGDAQSHTDLRIARVLRNDFAFVHNTFNIRVVVETTQDDPKSIPIILERNGEILGSRNVIWERNTVQDATLSETSQSQVPLPPPPKGWRRAIVDFETRPDAVGSFAYKVRAPIGHNDAIPENNHSIFPLNVIRDKIRVLQVAGRPSWDERFLRQHLKENPNVDLVSFFILRTPTDSNEVPQREMSLIPFPTQKLFTTELQNFDVIVFQNFDYRPYGMGPYLKNIRRAVENGLGFVMMGGNESFAAGGYAGTDIEDILPISLHTSKMLQATHPTKLTQAGHRHPITQLQRSGSPRALLASQTTPLWERLPLWPQLNQVGPLQPGAVALAVAGNATGDADPQMPVVAIWDVAKGRSMSIASDAMWRWRFAQKRRGGAAERAYHRFWNQTLRWLVRDPSQNGIVIALDAHEIAASQQAQAQITVRRSDHSPWAQAQIELSLENLSDTDGAQKSLPAAKIATTQERGDIVWKLPKLAPGAYALHARHSAQDAAHLPAGHAVWVVAPQASEHTRAMPQPDWMRTIATATGGVAQNITDADPSRMAQTQKGHSRIGAQKDIPIWRSPWLWLGVVAWLVADWVLRRRRGYV